MNNKANKTLDEIKNTLLNALEEHQEYYTIRLKNPTKTPSYKPFKVMIISTLHLKHIIDLIYEIIDIYEDEIKNKMDGDIRW